MKRLPDSELEVMLILWHHNTPTSTKDIHNLTDNKNKPIQITQTLLSRLQDKGFVECSKQNNSNMFKPLIDEESYRKSETSSFIEKLYSNSTSKLMATLIEDISDEELDEIKRLLNMKENQ